MRPTLTCALALSLLTPAAAALQTAPQLPQIEVTFDPSIFITLTSIDVPSKIAAVTVYPDGALVRRTAERPAGATEVFLRDLPASLDPASLRVVVEGGELVSFDLLPANRAASPDARIAELVAALEVVRAERRRLDDDLALVRAVEARLRRELSGDGATSEDLHGAERVEAWRATLPYLRAELERLAEEERGLEAALEEAAARERDLELELGALARGGASVRDLRLDIAAFADEGGAITVEYLVGGARWSPAYELRSAADLDAVELVHRARVWQESGEDWSDVELVLSTARPQRGAQGPEPRPRWVGLAAALGAVLYETGVDADLARLGYAAYAPAAAAEASTETSGLHVRYRLPRRESIASRPDPTTVLVGRRDLDVDVERYAVPAVDDTVWVRGRTTNDTGWTLLPGPLAVHVGDEYLGQSQLGQVTDGGDLELALGLDPRLTVERILVDEDLEQPGIFGSKVERTRSWRVRVTNDSGAPERVLLFEALPRSNDERVEVRFDRASPAPATGERFDRLREEQGVATFALDVPARGAAEASWRTRIAWPESETLAWQ